MSSLEGTTLAQDGNDLTGTYQTTFPILLFNSNGTVTGEVNGHDVTLTATPSGAGACPFKATATAQGGQITGTYAAFNCLITLSGSLTLTRQ